VIFDTRNYENPVETLIEKISGHLNASGAEIEKVDNIGYLTFVTGPVKKHAGDIYVLFDYKGAPNTPAVLAEKVRLDKTVKGLQVTLR